MLEESSFVGETGTQIKIPIKMVDVGNTVNSINNYLSYSILPYEVDGFDFEDTRPQLNIIGKDWGMITDFSSYYYSSNTPEPSTIVVAGIPYRINKRVLNNKFVNNNYQDVVQHLMKGKSSIKNDINLFNKFLYASIHINYVLMAPIGSVDLSASREDLQYTERTCCYLYLHLFKMYQDYCGHLSIDYVNNPSYLNACFRYTSKTSEVIKVNLLNEMVWEKDRLPFSDRPYLFSTGYGYSLKKYYIAEQGAKWNNTLKKVLRSDSISRIDINLKSNKSVFVLQDTSYINYTKFIKDYILRIKGEDYTVFVVDKEDVQHLCSWVLDSTSMLNLSDIVSEYKTYAANNKTTSTTKRDSSVFSAYAYQGSDVRSRVDAYARFFKKDKAPSEPDDNFYYVSNDEFHALREEGIQFPGLGYWTSFASCLNSYLDYKGILKSQVWFTSKPSRYFKNETWNSLADLIKKDFKAINKRELKAYSETVYVSKKVPAFAPAFVSLEPEWLSSTGLYSRLRNAYFDYKTEAKNTVLDFHDVAFLTIQSYRNLVESEELNHSFKKDKETFEGLIDIDNNFIKVYLEFVKNYPLIKEVNSYYSYTTYTKNNFRDYIYARSLVLKDDNKKIIPDLEVRNDSEYKLMMNYFKQS